MGTNRRESFSPIQSRIVLSKPNNPSASGIKLVLPSLTRLKAHQPPPPPPPPDEHDDQDQDIVVYDEHSPQIQPLHRTPRPVKLKPLKEVLSKLITQIKKKDDYAFFLKPVDVTQVAGYTDVVKRPMDLGTMTVKVNKGKYRSLEDFASDLRLVAMNAKLFNPPGTIYYSEAERIEAWGLEHIAKAAPTVIQYETDWNIEIEGDDNNTTTTTNNNNNNAGEDVDEDEGSLAGRRSVSVLSQAQAHTPTAASGGTTTRRGPRGPYKRSAGGQSSQAALNPSGISETLDPDGGLPGSKDGLGAFAPGSDWAKVMLGLKLKGKRYRTKKERMRFEREGPPYLADGSLDYTEMEDPFSILQFFVPDGPSRPYLLPLSFPSPSHQQHQLPQPQQPLTQYQYHPTPISTQTSTQTSTSTPTQAHFQTQFSIHTPTPAPTPTPQPSFQTTSYTQGYSTPILASPSVSFVSGFPPPPQSQLHPQAQPLSTTTSTSTTAPTPSHPLPHLFLPTTLPPTYTPSSPNLPQPPLTKTGGTSARRHWAITRGGGRKRGAGAGGDEEGAGMGMYSFQAYLDGITSGAEGGLEGGREEVGGREGREAHTLDWGSFAVLVAEMEAELGRRGGAGASEGVAGGGAGDADLESVRRSLDCASVVKACRVPSSSSSPSLAVEEDEENEDVLMGMGMEGKNTGGDYWSVSRAAEAEAYIRDVVYGGVDGLAYVRSLAEFMDYQRDEEEEADHESTTSTSFKPPSHGGLGMPLSKWVEQNVVDPLTGGKHSLLRETALELLHLPHPRSSSSSMISNQVTKSLTLYPPTTQALSALLQLRKHKIDMGALIKKPEELFLSEEEWAGKELKMRRRGVKRKAEDAVENEVGRKAIKMEEEEEEEEEEGEKTWMEVEKDVSSLKAAADVNVGTKQQEFELEGPEELKEVLEYVANAILELDRRIRRAAVKENGHAHALAVAPSPVQIQNGSAKKVVVANEDENMDKDNDRYRDESMSPLTPFPSSPSSEVAQVQVDADADAEDPAMRNLRLNLLALAKRAPLDTIARLPKDLVPEHIRHFVPTLGSTT